MRPWADVQNDFASALLAPGQAPPKEMVCATPRAELSERFNIYRNNVVCTGIDALAETFPAVHRLLGEAFFRATARTFLTRTPPSGPIMMEIGEGFGAFLEGFQPAETVPYIGDVARLEAARVRSYHAADRESLSLDKLADLPGERAGEAILDPHSAVVLVRSQYPVGSLWAATTGALDDSFVDMDRAEDVLILRPALQVETVILPSKACGTFASALFTGDSIAGAANEAAKVDPDFDLAQNLAGMVNSGAFSDLSLPETPHS